MLEYYNAINCYFHNFGIIFAILNQFYYIQAKQATI